MKLIENHKTFLSLIICLYLVANALSVSIIEHPKTTPDPPANPSDTVYKRIRGYIDSVAEEKMKSSDLLAKKKIAGVLPEGFPEEMIQRALKTRNSKRVWRPILSEPTEIYRTCLYPIANVNYVKWCYNNFFGEKNKGDTCLYNFCEVCCDHLVFIYQNAAEKNLIGELLQLNQEQGIKAIKDIVDKSQIHKCKIECKKAYQVDMPAPPIKPPRDPLLGTEQRPGMSCMDIKKWGAKSAKSGVYWIDVGSKGAQKVFCDMETDKGGWTLFFNYVHQPGQELLLNENKLPNDLKTNSHMYLEGAGFTARDVREIRLFCTERFKANKRFWHFKSNNPDVVYVAMTGDQTGLKPNTLVSGYMELKAPGNIQVKYTNAVNFNHLNQFDIVGKNPRGGFTTTVFGSSSYEANWTVKGDNPNQDVFECGTSHKLDQNTAADDNPSMVFSHHSVWFRGHPPSDEEAQARYINNASKPTKK